MLRAGAGPDEIYFCGRGKIRPAQVSTMKRSNFSTEKRLDIKFTDDLGSSEGAVDLGGPKRELCLQDLKDFSGMFEVPSGAKLLVCNAEGEIYHFPKILTIQYHSTFDQLKVNVKIIFFLSLFLFFYHITLFFHLFIYFFNVLFLYLCICSYEK